MKMIGGNDDNGSGFPQPLRFTNVEVAKNRRRFYELRWEQDLFDGPVLVRSFGRIGTEGRTLARSYPDQETAEKEISRLIKRRLQHGYQAGGEAK